MTAHLVTQIVEIFEDAAKSNDPRAASALAQWAALTMIIGSMDHILCHLDPAVLQQAVEDAHRCSQGDDHTALH